MNDLDGPSTPWRDRLLHPFSIAAILGLAIVGTCGGQQLLGRWEREARERELAPLRAEWDSIRADARAPIAAIEAAHTRGERSAEGCAALVGTITIVDAALLGPLAAGERFPRSDAPTWLSSDAWRYLAESSTPGEEVGSHRRRNEVVRAALARPCVGVLETQQASAARLVDADRFDGGEVAGRLRVVCVDPPRVACDAPIASAPIFAVAVVQGDRRAQAGANAMAVEQSSSVEYQRRVDEAVKSMAPGLVVEWRAE